MPRDGASPADPEVHDPKLARRVAYTALTCAGLNALASVVSVPLLLPGLPKGGRSLDERLGFVTEHLLGWRVGWLLWHPAALSLMTCLVALGLLWRRSARLTVGVAAVCAGSGLIADLLAQTTYLAVGRAWTSNEFLAAERQAGMFAGYLGNGLYSVAGVLVVWAGRAEIPRALVIMGVCAFGSGWVLSAAALLQSPELHHWATLVVMGSVCPWFVLVGLWLLGRERAWRRRSWSS